MAGPARLTVQKQRNEGRCRVAARAVNHYQYTTTAELAQRLREFKTTDNRNSVAAIARHH
jgi:hypothetical protein